VRRRRREEYEARDQYDGDRQTISASALLAHDKVNMQSSASHIELEMSKYAHVIEKVRPVWTDRVAVDAAEKPATR
jgi:hypothetical protein